MTKEISKEVRAKVFGMHLGCEMASKPKYGVGIVRGVDLGKLRVMATYSYNFTPDEDYIINDLDSRIEDCQLLLTPISEITDVDKAEFLDVTGMEPDGLDLFLLGHGSMHLSHLNDWVAGVDFLRSRGYMLPAFGITDLFEAGIAVRKKTIKK